MLQWSTSGVGSLGKETQNMTASNHPDANHTGSHLDYLYTLSSWLFLHLVCTQESSRQVSPFCLKHTKSPISAETRLSPQDGCRLHTGWVCICFLAHSCLTQPHRFTVFHHTCLAPSHLLFSVYAFFPILSGLPLSPPDHGTVTSSPRLTPMAHS